MDPWMYLDLHRFSNIIQGFTGNHGQGEAYFLRGLWIEVLSKVLRNIHKSHWHLENVPRNTTRWVDSILMLVGQLDLEFVEYFIKWTKTQQLHQTRKNMEMELPTKSSILDWDFPTQRIHLEGVPPIAQTKTLRNCGKYVPAPWRLRKRAGWGPDGPWWVLMGPDGSWWVPWKLR